MPTAKLHLSRDLLTLCLGSLNNEMPNWRINKVTVNQDGGITCDVSGKGVPKQNQNLGIWTKRKCFYEPTKIFLKNTPKPKNENCKPTTA